MRTGTAGALCVAAALGFAAGPFTAGVPAGPPEGPKVPADVDLAPFLDLGEFYVKPVPAVKDRKTGFVVGGKNDTALVRTLPSINGRTVAELEKDMRPAATSDVGSMAGFLGPDERLLDVLAADNDYVVGELGLTHQELAKHLHAVGTIGLWQHRNDRSRAEFVYHGRRFKVEVAITKGSPPSPFRDGTESGTNATVWNVGSGKKLEFALLVPYMIERYGFYEGKGTSYRVDPKQVVEVFDFLKAKVRKP